MALCNIPNWRIVFVVSQFGSAGRTAPGKFRAFVGSPVGFFRRQNTGDMKLGIAAGTLKWVPGIMIITAAGKFHFICTSVKRVNNRKV